jgi:hypothetical protein
MNCLRTTPQLFETLSAQFRALRNWLRQAASAAPLRGEHRRCFGGEEVPQNWLRQAASAAPLRGEHRRCFGGESV